MWAGLWLGVYAYCTPKRQGTNATSTRGVATHADTVTHSLAQYSARVETADRVERYFEAIDQLPVPRPLQIILN
jgi:hypothetical protein